jgi:hypothetical protein
MKNLYKGIAVAACALAFTATTASAEIVCNRDGDCWHVKHRHHYRPEFGLVIHPDGWRWRDHDRGKYHWREHEGRGYWRNGVWIQF